MLEIKLKKRTRFKRILIAPKYFIKHLKIGSGYVPLKNRIAFAFYLTKLIVSK